MTKDFIRDVIRLAVALDADVVFCDDHVEVYSDDLVKFTEHNALAKVLGIPRSAIRDRVLTSHVVTMTGMREHYDVMLEIAITAEEPKEWTP